MSTLRLSVVFAAVTLLNLLCVPSVSRAASPQLRTAGCTLDPYWPSPKTRVIRQPGGHASWFGGGGEAHTPERAHGFLAGGISLLTSKSLVNAWLLDGWTVTGGAELPVSRSWTLVPRAHFSGASGQNSGNILWARLAIDGRLSNRFGGLPGYQEAGLGMGVIRSPVSVMDADFNSRQEPRTSGTPFFQLIQGWRGDPDQAPAFMIEMIFVHGLGPESPGGLELVAGIEF